MAYRKKSNTKLTPDQILDTAADILETSGWVTGVCHNSVNGGHCAIGAVARAVYPNATTIELGSLSYIGNDPTEYLYDNGRVPDVRHVEAMKYLVASVKGRKTVPDVSLMPWDVDQVITLNDDARPEGPDDLWVEPAKVLTFKSSKRVVNKLRKAAELYRSKQAA